MKNESAFSPKDRVDHSVYGLGTIVDMNERLTTILFDDAGTKRFLTDKVQLAASDTPAPVKPVRRKRKAPTKSV